MYSVDLVNRWKYKAKTNQKYSFRNPKTIVFVLNFLLGFACLIKANLYEIKFYNVGSFSYCRSLLKVENIKNFCKTNIANAIHIHSSTLEPLSDQKCWRYCRFLGLKVLNSDDSYMFSWSSHFCKEIKIEKIQNSKQEYLNNIRSNKTWRVQLWIKHCYLCMEVTWNYAYSPFKPSAYIL